MKDEEKAPRWFTIREAAEYLSIGEPTLYRWMKDGKMTYRKIGDSTRFLQEDLDAFVQVFHSGKDAEKVRRTCPACNSDNLAEGDLRSTGLTYFKPAMTKFWTLKDSLVKVKAMMCLNCGAISAFGDTKKIAALIEGRKEEAEAGETEKQ